MKWSSTVLALAVVVASSSAFAPAASTATLHRRFDGFSSIATTTTTTPTTPTVSSSSSSRLWMMEPLAQEGEWAAYLDEQSTGLVYYFNAATGESKWEPPTSSFPSVYLEPDQRVAAKTKQKEYKASVVSATTSTAAAAATSTTSTSTTTKEAASTVKGEQENDTSGGFPFFGSRAKKTEDLADEQEADTKTGGGLLGAIFGRKSQENDDTADDDDDSAVNGAAAAIAASTAAAAASKPVTAAAAAAATDTTSIKIDMSAYVLPHPAKVRWGGEDAVFIRGRSFGVFDGVSGAEKLDGVPLYSVTLAQELKAMVDPKEFLSMLELTQILTSAAEFADKAATGASTAVVASLSDEGELNVLNVGDCTCAVVREGKVTAKTKEIIHYFDCPYQLSEDSPDRPRDGTKLKLKVKKGDVIVMGSDGIFDNLQDVEICELVSNQKTRSSALARKVVERSRRVSLDVSADTPYAKLAKRNGDEDYSSGLGGKVDDVSCIVVKCS